MNTLKVARLELNYLFFSPVAWIILVVFCVRAGAHITFLLASALSLQVQSGELGLSLTQYVFSLGISLYGHINQNLYFYIPMLTMAAISRETRSGSIKLLLSSPVRVIDIVLGKYVAILAFIGLFVAATMGMVIVGYFTIDSFDCLAVLPGILGVFLLGAAYAAIGLFMSSLTSYQVVAGISTIGVLAILNLVGAIGQRVPILADITYWLSLRGRTESFSSGLVSSSDLFYFLAIIALFLTFAILRLSGSATTETVLRRLVNYLSVFAMVCIFGFLTSRTNLTAYADLTATRSQSPSEVTRAVMNAVDGPWQLTHYVNVLGGNSSRVLPEYKRYLSEQYDFYLRSNPEMTMDFVYYRAPPTNNDYWYKELNAGRTDEQLAQVFAEQRGIEAAGILPYSALDSDVDLESEGFRFVTELRWDGKAAVLRNFDDQEFWPSERETTAAFRRLLIGPVTLGFATGPGRRSPVGEGNSGYKRIMTDVTYREALVNHGFEFENVPLQTGAPNTVDILVIGDPGNKLTAGELAALSSYIDGGGDLMIALEEESAAALSLLDVLGLTVVTPTNGRNVEGSTGGAVHFRYNSAAEEIGFIPPKFGAMSTVIASDPILIGRSDNTDFSAYPLLSSEDQESTDGTLAWALARPGEDGEQRIVIVGDADFASNATLGRLTSRSLNRHFVHDVFHWLTEGLYPVKLNRRDYQDKLLVIDREGIRRLRILLIGVFPACLVLAASLLLYSRRRA